MRKNSLVIPNNITIDVEAFFVAMFSFPRVVELYTGDLDEYLDSILGRIVDALHNPRMYFSEVLHVRNEICFHISDMEERSELTLAIIQFGDSLYQELKRLGAYDLTGQLDYYYSGRIGTYAIQLSRTSVYSGSGLLLKHEEFAPGRPERRSVPTILEVAPWSPNARP